VRVTAERRQRADLATRAAGRAVEGRRDAERMHRLLASLGSWRVAYDSALVAEGAPSVASARLAEVLGDAASASEAQLGAVQLSADTAVARGALMKTRVRATVSGDLMSIALFLETIEAGPPLLAVRELTVTQPQLGVTAGQAERLQAEVVVEGLFRGAAPTRGQ
jgi:hypothetical protein